MSDTVAASQLRAFVERIERLEEEKRTIADDIKEVKAEAKGCGFDVGAISTIVKLRKMDAAERQEKEAILDTYMAALGMLPLERAALDREARAKARTSEAMDDNKAFSAQMLADGLISEKAHAENIAISDGVAKKYGAGVVDPETGEIIEQNSPATANDMDRADDGSFETGIVAAENRLEANPAGPVAGEVNHAGAGESPAPIPEPFEPPAFLVKAAKPLRPLCLNPEECAGYGSHTCHRCLKASGQAEVAA